MEWLKENLFSIISLLFGTGGIGYAIVARILDRKKYKSEVKEAEANANIKGDEFWKKRYDVLQQEINNKDEWWKARYDSLLKEYENERKLSNDIVAKFRDEKNAEHGKRSKVDF